MWMKLGLINNVLSREYLVNSFAKISESSFLPVARGKYQHWHHQD